MKVKFYNICFILLIALVMSACAKDEKVNEPTNSDGTEPIAISGSLVRNAVPNTTGLYLKAFLAGTPPTVLYLGETPINATGGLTSTETAMVFPGAVPFYPLGNVEIRFYAYTGKAPNDIMKLTAGQGMSHDYVLSNYGKRTSWSSVDPSYESNGTPGSSTDPAELLQFRHVMTQLIVDVEVDATETPDPVSPPPTNVRFTLPNVVARGEYGIRAAAPVAGNEAIATVASNTSGTYTIRLGENYLVPTGANLTGAALQSLVIDDYTATPADLSGFTITPQNPGDPMWLVPGYSYKLTLTVRRLRVTGVRIEKIDWQARELNDNNTTFTPQPLALSLGSYYNIGGDAITKVVLHTSDGKQFVGGLANGRIEFVTLPTSSVVRADLYTYKGLLISQPITTEYSAGTLSLPISSGGMLLEDPYQPASATNPYLITTPVQFLNVSKDLAASYKQVENIDLKNLSVSGSDAIFSGFGELTGRYNGNGKYISNVSISGPGLFSINSGAIENVRLYTGMIDGSGQTFAGSICGINNGIIVACINEVQIANSPNTAGGICGFNNTSGTILGCINTANITHGRRLGGIAGYNTNTSEGVISACINTGSLDKMGDNLGGICGESLTSTNNIIRTSFWLIGTVQKDLQEYEVAVDTEGVLTFDTTALDPDALRNNLSAGDTEDKRVVNRLNAELALYPQWSNLYQYVLNRTQTGITWPAPVIK